MKFLLHGIFSQAPPPPASYEGAVIIAMRSHTIDNLHAYKWDDVTGWGVKYANPAQRHRAEAQGGQNQLTVTADQRAFVLGTRYGLNSSQWLESYRWEHDGFGVRYAGQSIGTGNAIDPRFMPGSDAVIYSRRSHGSPKTAGMGAIGWTYADGFGSIYANPTDPVTHADGGTHAVYRCIPDPGGAVASMYYYHGNATTDDPAASEAAYHWSDGWGAKFADPGTWMSRDPVWTDMAPDGLSIGTYTTMPSDGDRLRGRAFNPATGFGTVYPQAGLENSTLAGPLYTSPDGARMYYFERVVGSWHEPKQRGWSPGWSDVINSGPREDTTSADQAIAAIRTSEAAMIVGTNGNADKLYALHVSAAGFGVRFADPAINPFDTSSFGETPGGIGHIYATEEE